MQYFLSYITKCARTRNSNITCLNFIHFSRKSSYLTDKSFLKEKQEGERGRWQKIYFIVHYPIPQIRIKLLTSMEIFFWE